MKIVITDRPENAGRNNYEIALAWLLRKGIVSISTGEICDLEIRHDSWCGIYDGARCDCTPDLVVDGKPVKYPDRLLKKGTRQ